MRWPWSPTTWISCPSPGSPPPRPPYDQGCDPDQTTLILTPVGNALDKTITGQKIISLLLLKNFALLIPFSSSIRRTTSSPSFLSSCEDGPVHAIICCKFGSIKLTREHVGGKEVGQVGGDLVQLVHEDVQGRLGDGWTELER